MRALLRVSLKALKWVALGSFDGVPPESVRAFKIFQIFQEPQQKQKKTRKHLDWSEPGI